ncbi:adhesion G-protein coupled receptor G2-like isoform X1 [Ptychodera flava]|uniref:adhesion G-protein coupled receptor G2-like isoform X1 n=1 Tax=Ptychodera flava TaxID=63121 RepID=UPI003969FF6A
MLSFLVFIPLVKNQDGCRVANILRVYLILVSLMWNGVEGFNMYLSLIQVFTGYVSHFVLKCGIIAWSVPAVIVTFPLFFDVTCYDGFYSPESNCAFVCQLPANTLYFVLLLPMSIIIVCNSAVFVMVIQVLRKQSRPDQSLVDISCFEHFEMNRKQHRRKFTELLSVSGRSSTVDQLRGAVAMLVLLGLAWVFSGFAVINYNQVGKDYRSYK